MDRFWSMTRRAAGNKKNLVNPPRPDYNVASQNGRAGGLLTAGHGNDKS